MKNIVVISASPRIDGNSETLCKEFIEGASNNPENKVEFIKLREKKINYCRGCYACVTLGKCFQNDSMNDIVETLENANVIVLASPVYFYSMSGQLKVFIDRLVQNYRKIQADIYIFLTAADVNSEHLKIALEGIRGLTRDNLEGCTEKGVILASGVSDKGDIKNKDYLDIAYKMGKNV